MLTINEARSALKKRKIIVYPTDTVWGIGCNPFDQESVDNLFHLKGKKENGVSRLVNNLNDDLAFERIINVPKRGIGLITLKKINVIARRDDLSMFEAAHKFINQDSSKTIAELSNFLSKTSIFD